MRCLVPDCPESEAYVRPVPEGGRAGLCHLHRLREQRAAREVEWRHRMDHEDYNPAVRDRRVEVEAREARDRRDRALAAVDTSRWVDGQGTRYGLAALQGIVSDLRRDGARGGRNEALNRAAFRCGQLVSGGELSEGVVVETLGFCGEALELPRGEAGPTVRRGLRDGLEHPRGAPAGERGSYRDRVGTRRAA